MRAFGVEIDFHRPEYDVRGRADRSFHNLRDFGNRLEGGAGRRYSVSAQPAAAAAIIDTTQRKIRIGRQYTLVLPEGSRETARKNDTEKMARTSTKSAFVP